MTRNKYDEGLAPSGPTRLAAAVLLTIGGLLIVIPPNGFWSTLSMGAVTSGLFGLYMFLGYAWTDIRAGRIRFEDD